jgi:hypothetical protein
MQNEDTVINVTARISDWRINTVIKLELLRAGKGKHPPP